MPSPMKLLSTMPSKMPYLWVCPHQCSSSQQCRAIPHSEYALTNEVALNNEASEALNNESLLMQGLVPSWCETPLFLSQQFQRLDRFRKRQHMSPFCFCCYHDYTGSWRWGKPHQLHLWESTPRSKMLQAWCNGGTMKAKPRRTFSLAWHWLWMMHVWHQASRLHVLHQASNNRNKQATPERAWVS